MENVRRKDRPNKGGGRGNRRGSSNARGGGRGRGRGSGHGGGRGQAGPSRGGSGGSRKMGGFLDEDFSLVNSEPAPSYEPSHFQTRTPHHM